MTVANCNNESTQLERNRARANRESINKRGSCRFVLVSKLTSQTRHGGLEH
jgi:hypothetical protein